MFQLQIQHTDFAAYTSTPPSLKGSVALWSRPRPGWFGGTLVGVQQILKHAQKQWKAPILVLTKAAKIVTTRRVFRAKNTQKCFCGRGSTPDPAGGGYSAPPDPLDGFEEEEGTGMERVN